MAAKRALICGVSGQDGALLANFLLEKGYEVYGTSRDAELGQFANLTKLGIRERVHVRSMSMTDFRGVLQTLVEVEPDEIYNLAGQSSVGLSFQQPVETLESIAHATLTLLEAVRFLRKPLRLYNAASGECFGETPSSAPATEQSQFKPRSPYGVAKAAAFWEVANYREAYGVFACSGILFNHESTLRPARFVTQKVVQAAVRIAAGEPLRLKLGQLSVIRDWGWAPEYVDAMWRMLQQDVARDYVIATGRSRRLEEFIALVFCQVNLDWRDHIDIDPTLFRASDISENYADPSLARRELEWSAELSLEDIIMRLVTAERTAGNPAPAKSQTASSKEQ